MAVSAPSPQLSLRVCRWSASRRDNDQPDNAKRVAASDVGRVVAADAPPADIATAVRELLADPAALREARRFAGGDAARGTL